MSISLLSRYIPLILAFSPSLSAQVNERPFLVGSGERAVDISGRSVKNPRVRAVHSDDPNDLGSTAYFIQRDPFLAYQLGRNLNFREFRNRDGVFSEKTSTLAGKNPDGITAKITAENHTSCAGCHNFQSINPGGGPSFHKDSGYGRNTPHYYGGGIVEMLAIQVREEILIQVDTNNDGWVSVAEAAASPTALMVQASPGRDVNYGTAQLSGGSTGVPGLNNIFRAWYVDSAGVWIDGATEVGDVVDGREAVGYNFEMAVWGWGQGEGRAALNPTNRAFFWDPMEAHTGLEAFDPSTMDDPDGDGVSLPTLSGAIQFPAAHQPRDKGENNPQDPLGFSTDDIDEDGYLNELSEGDLDLAEFFMLNAPRPAFRGTPGQYKKGLKVFKSFGCGVCHVPNWVIKEEDGRFAGDRRLFDLDVSYNKGASRLEGQLVSLFTKVGSDYVLDRGEFLVEGLFSDLAHHDMGEGFKEVDFGGTQNTIWRTPPLWGVGSTAPYGHDGRSLTLEDAILRHDGEGAISRGRYQISSPAEQAALLLFLSRLVLYDIEDLPTDIDGDGLISPDHLVAGVSTGIERFNAEWLFKTPVEIQGDVTVNGLTQRSFAAVNLDDAYGLTLPFRIDSDLDGWPDVWDNAPFTQGFKDGVNN